MLSTEIKSPVNVYIVSSNSSEGTFQAKRKCSRTPEKSNTLIGQPVFGEVLSTLQNSQEFQGIFRCFF